MKCDSVFTVFNHANVVEVVSYKEHNDSVIRTIPASVILLGLT